MKVFPPGGNGPRVNEADRLLDLLDALEPAGDFCTWGGCRADWLVVEGVGPVPLPIQPAQARALVRVARARGARRPGDGRGAVPRRWNERGL